MLAVLLQYKAKSRQIEAGQCGFWMCVYGTAAAALIKCVCYLMVSCLCNVFCALLLGVLVLLAGRFVWPTVSGCCSCQSRAKTTS